MQNNRPITIYTARSRRDLRLQAAPMDVHELFSRLEQSQAIPYSCDAYKALPKAQQDDLKDIGAYIAGELQNGSRRNGCVLTRCAAVLDADNLSVGGTGDFLRRVDGLGCCYCVHSTAKHSPGAPRLRAVIPFAEDMPAEQYAPVVRILCSMIQPEMSWYDPSTDQAGRIMYNPAHCQDVAAVYEVGDKPLLDAKALLSQWGNWRDAAEWPNFPRAQAPTKLAEKQADPTGKSGPVGAFCRTYDVPGAMAKFLPGVYEEAAPGRYTFTGGSTWGGAVLYQDGKFLFSHHATDPAGGKLVNAFDLVRLHLFGEQDDEAKPGTRGNRLPSYMSMIALVHQDPQASLVLAQENFAGGFTEEPTDQEAAIALGRCDGEAINARHVRLALRATGIRVRKNLITGAAEISGMPDEYSREEAANTLPVYLLDILRGVGLTGVTVNAISNYLANILDKNRYNPVCEMIEAAPWDGVERFPALLETLFIKPDSFDVVLVKKWLIQCVAMAYNDAEHPRAAEGALTLQGPQGIGKTLLFRRLSIRESWFAEGVTLDIRNKDHILRATGAWICELGELDSTLKKEQSGLKAFITAPTDTIRAPYAREAVKRTRHTSVCATVNPDYFLKDDTGDRRFWVVRVNQINLDKLLALSEEWFIQLWREVYNWYGENPEGFRLTKAEQATLNERNQDFREPLPGEEEIRQALNWDLPPERWGEFSATDLARRLFINPSSSTIRQTGRAISKIAREDERIKSRILHGVRLYSLPLANGFGDFGEFLEPERKR